MLNYEKIPNLNTNSNRVSFDPLLAKNKLSKTGKIPDLANFRQFFGQKVGQMLLNLNFKTRFEILSSFSISWAPFCLFSHFEFLTLPCQHENFKADAPDLDIDRFC